MTPTEKIAAAEWSQRGTVVTTHPYHPYPYTVAPNAYYSGTVPLGPYSQAWQGVQKTNAIARVGTRYAMHDYLIPGAHRASTTFIQKNNPTGTYIGPGIANAQAHAAAARFAARTPKQSIGASIMSRLRGS